MLASQSAPVGLFTSTIDPEGQTSFVENGIPLSWTFQTCVVKDNEQMAQSEIAEMQVKTNVAPGIPSLGVSILDQNGVVLATTVYDYQNFIPQGWDLAQWDNSMWDSVLSQGLAARRIDFSAPVVYNRMAVQCTGTSGYGYKIGDIHVRARILGYLQEVA